METVKLRTALIEDIMKGKCNLPDVPLIESAALQFRKVLELIAFGSLVANEKVYKATHADFAKDCIHRDSPWLAAVSNQDSSSHNGTPIHKIAKDLFVNIGWHR